MKKVLFTIVALVLATGLALVPVAASGSSAWVELETLTVDAKGAVATSTTTLLNGVSYKIKASGTYSAGASITADAEYSSGPVSYAWQEPVEGYEYLGVNLLDLKVDGAFVNWGAYNASHVYTLDYAGIGSTVSFQIYDTYSPNNSGSLTVKIYALASLDIEKTGPECAHEGDIITYTYTVHNDGDVPLTAPTVTDDLGIAVSPVLDGHPCNIGDTNNDGVFDPCETWQFTASYLVPTPQVPNVENEAEAIAEYDGTEVSDTASWSVDIQHPEITVEKTGPAEEAYYNGTVVTYSYEVTNTGDCDLYDVSLVDDNGTPGDITDDVPITLSPLDGLDADGYDDLAQGHSANGSADFTLTCDGYTTSLRLNTATAEGTDSQELTVYGTDTWKVIIFQWQPRTIGYWGNWANHWTGQEMFTLVRYVNAQSAYFNYDNLTVEKVKEILLAPDQTGKMDATKAKTLLLKQLLATWLNVKSYEGWTDVNILTPGSPDASMNPEAMVYFETGGSMTVRGLLDRIEYSIASMDAKGLLKAKDILDMMNNAENNHYLMFMDPAFDPTDP
jgi:uncharacterized repeat protein (TIGR01451 family)